MAAFDRAAARLSVDIAIHRTALAQDMLSASSVDSHICALRVAGRADPHEGC